MGGSGRIRRVFAGREELGGSGRGAREVRKEKKANGRTEGGDDGRAAADAREAVHERAAARLGERGGEEGAGGGEVREDVRVLVVEHGDDVVRRRGRLRVVRARGEDVRDPEGGVGRRREREGGAEAGRRWGCSAGADGQGRALRTYFPIQSWPGRTSSMLGVGTARSLLVAVAVFIAAVVVVVPVVVVIVVRGGGKESSGCTRGPGGSLLAATQPPDLPAAVGWPIAGTHPAFVAQHLPTCSTWATA
jgi:hypothetical protein